MAQPVPADMQLDEEEASWTADQFQSRQRLIENDIRVQKSEIARLTHEEMTMKDKVKENQEKIKLNKQLPYLVANVQELLDQVCSFVRSFVMFCLHAPFNLYYATVIGQSFEPFAFVCR